MNRLLLILIVLISFFSVAEEPVNMDLADNFLSVQEDRLVRAFWSMDADEYEDRQEAMSILRESAEKDWVMFLLRFSRNQLGSLELNHNAAQVAKQIWYRRYIEEDPKSRDAYREMIRLRDLSIGFVLNYEPVGVRVVSDRTWSWGDYGLKVEYSSVEGVSRGDVLTHIDGVHVTDMVKSYSYTKRRFNCFVRDIICNLCWETEAGKSHVFTLSRWKGIDVNRFVPEVDPETLNVEVEVVTGRAVLSDRQRVTELREYVSSRVDTAWKYYISNVLFELDIDMDYPDPDESGLEY